MIRQSISCDICGTDVVQTNRCFVAYTQTGELRIVGWSPTGRLRNGARHLCGQECLHKFLDLFIAGDLQAAAVHTQPSTAYAGNDTSLTNAAPCSKPQASRAFAGGTTLTRLMPELATAVREMAMSRDAEPAHRQQTIDGEKLMPRRVGNARTEAWERERERERRAVISAARRDGF